MNVNQSIVCLEMPTGGASDLRLKQDVTPLINSLEKVLALKPVTWHWKEDKEKKKLEYGFIAQDVEAVFPHLVSDQKWHDGSYKKFLSVGEITPHVVEAVKEQNTIISDLSDQVAHLIILIQKQQQQITILQKRIQKRETI